MAEEGSYPEGAVIDLKRETQFVEGGIVSKTLLETKDVELDIFCLSDGQELSEHTSSKDAIVHVIGGEGTVTLGEMSHVAETGFVFYIPAKLPHSIHAKKNLVFLLTLTKKH